MVGRGGERMGKARTTHTLLLLSLMPLGTGEFSGTAKCQTTTASVSLVLGCVVYHLCCKSAWFFSDKSPDSLSFICLHRVLHNRSP